MRVRHAAAAALGLLAGRGTAIDVDLDDAGEFPHTALPVAGDDEKVRRRKKTCPSRGLHFLGA